MQSFRKFFKGNNKTKLEVMPAIQQAGLGTMKNSGGHNVIENPRVNTPKIIELLAKYGYNHTKKIPLRGEGVHRFDKEGEDPYFIHQLD